MAEDQDDEQKTEQPTSKRLEEAAKKGNIPFSREVSNFMALAVLAFTIAWFMPMMMRNTGLLLTPYLSDADSLPTDARGLGFVMRKTLFGAIAIVAAPMICVFVASIASNFIQNGFILNDEAFRLKFERLSLIGGFKRMFSMRSVAELVKSMIKMMVVGTVAFIAVYPDMPHIRQLPNDDIHHMLLFLMTVALRMTIGMAVAMFFIAILDVLYQRFQYMKSMRMTRQEIRDEYKQSEGDPMVKQRLRRMRAERARNRMMSNVPKADVVITNPTHFAVALQYDSAKMKAPTVTAMGQDLIALKIREIAEENDVPIVENPPLARALFASAKLEEEIPLAHYEAVAKVISYVYQLKGRR